MTDSVNHGIFWFRTSLSMYVDNRRPASLEYRGSSTINPAAVRIDNSSSSLVVAPSASADIVRVATRIGSTPISPSAQRATAFTILLTSTSSRSPFRLRTRIVVLCSDLAFAPFAFSEPDLSISVGPVMT